jgi:hypothetical protein
MLTPESQGIHRGARTRPRHLQSGGARSIVRHCGRAARSPTVRGLTARTEQGVEVAPSSSICATAIDSCASDNLDRNPNGGIFQLSLSRMSLACASVKRSPLFFLIATFLRAGSIPSDNRDKLSWTWFSSYPKRRTAGFAKTNPPYSPGIYGNPG